MQTRKNFLPESIYKMCRDVYNVMYSVSVKGKKPLYPSTENCRRRLRTANQGNGLCTPEIPGDMCILRIRRRRSAL